MPKKDLSPRQALRWNQEEVQAKHKAIKDYIASDKFPALPPAEQDLIKKEASLLFKYSIILQKRIINAEG